MTTFPCPKIHHTLSQTAKPCTRYTSMPTCFSIPPITLLFYIPIALPGTRSCYTSSTPTLVMTLCLHYIAPIPCLLHFTLGPASSLWYAPISRQCIPVGIEIHHHCSPLPVRLGMYRCAHKHYVYGKLINMLMNEQDWACPG